MLYDKLTLIDIITCDPRQHGQTMRRSDPMQTAAAAVAVAVVDKILESFDKMKNHNKKGEKK